MGTLRYCTFKGYQPSYHVFLKFNLFLSRFFRQINTDVILSIALTDTSGQVIVASKKKIVVWNYETMTVVTKLKLNLESGSKSFNLTSSNLLQLFLPHNCVEGGEIFAVSAGKKNLRPLLRVQLTGDAAPSSPNCSVIFRHVTLATQHVGDTSNTLVSLSDHKAGLKKNQASGFFLFFYIFAQKRELLGFFQFQEYF